MTERETETVNDEPTGRDVPREGRRAAMLLAGGAERAAALREGAGKVAQRLSEPRAARRVAMVALPLLVIAALLLPPFSLARRFAARGHARVVPGMSIQIPARGDDSISLEIARRDIVRQSRISVWTSAELPRGIDPVPAGQVPISQAYRLDVRGPAPREARLSANLPIGADSQAFVDPYGWDGERWQWLAPEFVSANRVRIVVPFERFVPDPIVATLARGEGPHVSAVLLPPPARMPAAAAELPSVELRAYRLADDQGGLERREYPPLPLDARRTAVVDNMDGPRVRDDLVTNVLIRPETRRRHRQELVRLAVQDRVDALVIDYSGIPGDLQRPFSDLVSRLAQDLTQRDIELSVVLPVPRSDGANWDPGAVDWRAIGAQAHVRIRLPDDRPLEITTLDSMIRWAVGQVERRRLQLAVPVWGRDVHADDVVRVGFGEALQRVLDMALSDAPRRLTPGAETEVELPTIRAAELGRDIATGMWRFSYWDRNRRQHHVWLNDAEGLAPAFEVAAHYRLGMLALDGVSAAADPRVWRLVSSFLESGEATAGGIDYLLRWQLVDAEGRIVEEALQPLEESVFRFEAPSTSGDFSLRVDLVTGDGGVAAVGVPLPVSIAPPPPPSPTPTIVVLRSLPTPETYATAPPPSDEIGVVRTPVRIGDEPGPGTDVPELPWDAEVEFAEAALRAEPDVSSERLSDLRRGDRMLILDRSADERWLRVRITATGLEGWVLARLVSVRETAGTGTPPPGATAGRETATADPPDADPGAGGTAGAPRAPGRSPSITPTVAATATPSAR